MFDSLFMGTVIWSVLIDEPEVLVTNVELYKIIRIRFIMKIININLQGSGCTKEILIKMESKL